MKNQFYSTKTAIVLVEFQKQWTEKGLFHWLIKNQLETRNVVENTKRLVAESRKLGVRIIHAPLIVDPHNKKGWMAYPTFGKLFTKDSWKSDFVSGLYRDGDPVAKREYYNLQAFDAFFESPLEKILNDLKITNIFICGFATDQCPMKTLGTAKLKGFNPFLVSDCTATFNSFLQKNTERKLEKQAITSDDLIESINIKNRQ